MPLNPKERDDAIKIDSYRRSMKCPMKNADNAERLAHAALRLNAETLRQRRTIEHLKRRLRAWEGN